MRLYWAVTLSLVFCLLGVACASDPQDDVQEEAMDFEDFAEPVHECSSAWQGLIDGWHREIGSLGSSVISTQEAVLEKGDSRFSRAILEVWSETQKFVSGSFEWGRWPVSDEAFREQTHLISKAFEQYVPEACSSASWLYSLIGRALYVGADGNEYGYMVPDDAPSKSHWNSPELQQWYVFWLFIRHPELGESP